MRTAKLLSGPQHENIYWLRPLRLLSRLTCAEAAKTHQNENEQMKVFHDIFLKYHYKTSQYT
jgi:hypothetical protein